MAWQVDVFEMRTKQAEVAIGGGKKNSISDGLPGEIPALAGLPDLELSACHGSDPKTLPEAGTSPIELCETETLLIRGTRRII